MLSRRSPDITRLMVDIIEAMFRAERVQAPVAVRMHRHVVAGL